MHVKPQGSISRLSSLRGSLDPEKVPSTCGLAADNAQGIERARGGAIEAAGALEEARCALAQTLGGTDVVEAQEART